MEIKRPSHICAGAVFEFAAIFWNLFEKFLQKASFKHALALAFKGIAFCFRTYFCTASGYINSSCGTFTVFVIGTVVGFAVNLDGLTSTAVFGTVHGTLALFPEASAANIKKVRTESTLLLLHSRTKSRAAVQYEPEPHLSMR